MLITCHIYSNERDLEEGFADYATKAKAIDDDGIIHVNTLKKTISYYETEIRFQTFNHVTLTSQDVDRLYNHSNFPIYHDAQSRRIYFK